METTKCNENNNEKPYLVIWLSEDPQNGQYELRISEFWADCRENALKAFYHSDKFDQCIRVINCFTKTYDS
jgi:hypothetical protein